MLKSLKLLVALVTLCWSHVAFADVQMHFHSFDGSVLFGRYPHAFVVLEGTLDDGTRVDENFGFTAKNTTPAILNGPVEHTIMTESEKSIRSTNRHFTVTLSDAQYARVKREVAAWRNAPGKFYDLDRRNCIHFVGRMAQLAGLKVTYPATMLRRPKMWLNHVAKLNPKLGAKQL
ncbi:hypothetical protein [Alteriqipengyuania lutimaris]|uniref:DUF4105 domain-containing protein n=1 Tax=Alteriqipengyuania lutimaris TaxID=1538146 RepID=A0A395LJ97_9SPHN|nr:hypothetical protein [Alteriqipengyuania lutimaris]MBB3034013.1 hypothetical protein [Alteriqipengyuania lutimaris]RDS77038.1 hypothetical protein DL238_05040 [Alteriqipengyuania lutimaris]